MGIPTFWASPFPKTLVIWASPSDNNLAIWVRVRVTGDAHIIGFSKWGCPKSGDLHITVKEAPCVTRGLGRDEKKGRVIFFRLFSCCFCNIQRKLLRRKEVFHFNYKVCLLLAVTRNEMI